MLNEVVNLALSRGFFAISKQNSKCVKFKLNYLGELMKSNIKKEWLQSLHSKSRNNFKVLVNDSLDFKNDCYVLNNPKEGLAEITKSDDSFVISDNLSEYFHSNEVTKLKIMVPVLKLEAMQFFLQWQRYRKIWWSSITTTPGLFNMKDIAYKEDGAEVDIIAKFPWGNQSVETISIKDVENKFNKSKLSIFESVFTTECALLTLLSDGYLNRTEEGYLRLHRNMAPYKVSFAINSKDSVKMQKLREIADLVNYELNSRGISSWLPDNFTSLDDELMQKYHLGVPYTVILTENTLENGIFNLHSSSTTLSEQVHISDFSEYTSKLFKSTFC